MNVFLLLEEEKDFCGIHLTGHLPQNQPKNIIRSNIYTIRIEYVKTIMWKALPN